MLQKYMNINNNNITIINAHTIFTSNNPLFFVKHINHAYETSHETPGESYVITKPQKEAILSQ